MAEHVFTKFVFFTSSNCWQMIWNILKRLKRTLQCVYEHKKKRSFSSWSTTLEFQHTTVSRHLRLNVNFKPWKRCHEVFHLEYTKAVELCLPRTSDIIIPLLANTSNQDSKQRTIDHHSVNYRTIVIGAIQLGLSLVTDWWNTIPLCQRSVCPHGYEGAESSRDVVIPGTRRRKVSNYFPSCNFSNPSLSTASVLLNFNNAHRLLPP